MTAEIERAVVPIAPPPVTLSKAKGLGSQLLSDFGFAILDLRLKGVAVGGTT
jgi:hypothetical protein